MNESSNIPGFDQTQSQSGIAAKPPLNKSQRLMTPLKRTPFLYALGVLLLGLAITALGSAWLRDLVYYHQKSRFERMAERVHTQIKLRVNSYGTCLRGARGPFLVQPNLNREEFVRYCKSRRLIEEFPGVLGIGYIKRVPRDDLEWFVNETRNDGAPDFQIKTSGDADELYVIKYIEHADRNSPELGLDIATDPIRREAAQHAMLTGEPVLSKSIPGLSEKNKTRFYYLLAIYDNAMSTDTPEERRAACTGWTYAPLVMRDVIEAIPIVQEKFMDLEVFAGSKTSSDNLLFDLDSHHLEMKGLIHDHDFADRMYNTQIKTDIGGQHFSIRLSSTPRYEVDVNYASAYTAAFAGTILSILITALVWMLGISRAKALSLADSMVSDLQNSQEAAESTLRDLVALQLALDQHTIVSITDMSGKIIHANDAFCKISGYTSDELLGENHRIINSGYHTRDFWGDMWRNVAEGRVWRGEVCNRAKDGSIYWVDSMVIPFMDANEKVQKIISIRFDITSRKVIEMENRMLADVARRTRNGAVLLNKYGYIEWVNEGFTRLTGYSFEQAKGKMVCELLHGEKTDSKVAEEMNDAIQQGQSFTGELIEYNSQGHDYVAHIEMEPLFDERGYPNGFLTIKSDVTMERRMEDVMRANMENFRNLAEASPMLVWTSGRDSKRNYFNQRWLEFTSQTLIHELQNWLEGIHPEDQENFQHTYQSAFHSRVPFEVEYRLRRQDDQYRIMLDRGAPRSDSNGDFDGYVGAAMDITDNKLYEQEIIRLRKDAEEANRTKSEFLANMSHEIRTPMSAILGYTDLMLNDSDYSQRPELQHEALHTIQRNGTYLLELINDILDLSKIEAGKMTVENLECSPLQILQDVESLMVERARAKNLELKVEFQGPLPRSIQSDPLRLRQILVNLTGNALKFTMEGSVRVIARYVCSPRPCMEFDVIDTGAGMSYEQTQKLFQPFTQADSSTTRKFGGTGLGLTISRRLAQFLGGDVTIVESSVSVGTTFRLTIAAGEITETIVKPILALEPTNRGISQTTLAALPHDCKILLAEDGVDNQRMISFILKKAGANVSVAENGKIAVEKVHESIGSEGTFDVILMDMQMPEMDGYEATKLLREQGYTMPIIALTAHAMSGDREKCLNCGCSDYLTKPVNKTGLVNAINQHLGSESNKPATV